MRIRLSVTAGPHQGREFCFTEHDTFIVGRGSRADFRLSMMDRYFSRMHFLVEMNPPLCRIMDLGSRNGTWINGDRVQLKDLVNGDVIRAGKTIIQVEVQQDLSEVESQLDLSTPSQKFPRAGGDSQLRPPSSGEVIVNDNIFDEPEQVGRLPQNDGRASPDPFEHAGDQTQYPPVLPNKTMFDPPSKETLAGDLKLPQKPTPPKPSPYAVTPIDLASFSAHSTLAPHSGGIIPSLPLSPETPAAPSSFEIPIASPPPEPMAITPPSGIPALPPTPQSLPTTPPALPPVPVQQSQPPKPDVAPKVYESDPFDLMQQTISPTDITPVRPIRMPSTAVPSIMYGSTADMKPSILDRPTPLQQLPPAVVFPDLGPEEKPKQPGSEKPTALCKLCRLLEPAGLESNEYSHPLCAECRAKIKGMQQEFRGFLCADFLGMGGMGMVFLALREKDGVPVALKTLIPAVGAKKNERDRFLREASLLKQLSHPNIVGHLDQGEAQGKFFFAMEYVPGKTAELILAEEAPLAIPRVVDWICQLLDALDYAHNRQMVHRDVRPANFIISATGKKELLKLVDFGLGKIYQSSSMSGITIDNNIMGTLPFMAPEQVTEFKKALPPADQYSAAASLYNLLTGKHPMDLPEMLFEAVRRILENDPVPIRDRRPDVPAGLAEVIQKALSRDAKNRYASVLEFRKALSPYKV